MKETQTAAVRQSSAWRRCAFGLLSMLYLALIYGAPAWLWVAVYEGLRGQAWRLAWAFAGPVVYGAGFLLVAGYLSLFHQKGIVVGRFPRDTGHPIYFHRRLYGLCWTALFYCKPVYALCLAAPWLKWLTFRLFGYRGGMKFTVYPDTWIRDLPLLRFGEGVYISNRVTLGSNIALSNGDIMVDRIEMGDGALVGHLCVLGPGFRMGRGAELGVASEVGIGCSIGDGARVQPTCGLEHGVVVKARAVVGTRSYLGSKAMIGEGIHLAPATLLPRRAAIRSQDDLPRYVSSATRPALDEKPEVTSNGQ